MRLFVRFVLGAYAVAFVISIGNSIAWIEASEPDDTKVSQPASDDCQENDDGEFSWADCDTPGYQLFPMKAGRVGIAGNPENLNEQGEPSTAPRSIVCDQNEAFFRLHSRFQSEFSGHDYDGFHGLSRFRGRGLRDINRFSYGNLLTWYIVEWSGNLWIEPRPFLADDEFRSVKIDLISKRSPILRITKRNASKSMETFGNSEEDFDRSTVTYDPLVRLLEASNQRATRTEWKIARLQLISMMKHTPSGTVNNHPIITACEKHDASSETLNAFEHRAVAELESNPAEKVVMNSSDGENQVVGPLRAVGHCTKCHQVADGTLLGVFSYRLIRTDPSR